MMQHPQHVSGNTETAAVWKKLPVQTHEVVGLKGRSCEKKGQGTRDKWV